MSRIIFKDNGEDHNFWQNYSDLMAGFLIVFIITSIVAWYGYIKVTGAIGGDGGNIKVTIEQSRMIREFMDAQRSLNSDYFHYNDTYQLFDSKIDVIFLDRDASIPDSNQHVLFNAGKELENILTPCRNTINIPVTFITKAEIASRLSTMRT